jgi:hypothetical protein
MLTLGTEVKELVFLQFISAIRQHCFEGATEVFNGTRKSFVQM